jgi:hypothetical protein
VICLSQQSEVVVTSDGVRYVRRLYDGGSLVQMDDWNGHSHWLFPVPEKALKEFDSWYETNLRLLRRRLKVDPSLKNVQFRKSRKYFRYSEELARYEFDNVVMTLFVDHLSGFVAGFELLGGSLAEARERSRFYFSEADELMVKAQEIADEEGYPQSALVPPKRVIQLREAARRYRERVKEVK